MRTVFLLLPDGTTTKLTAVRKDRQIGDLLNLKGCDEPMRVMYHMPNGNLVVLPQSRVPYKTSCAYCVRERKTSNDPIDIMCLACRRQYPPPSSAFYKKSDFFNPGNNEIS